MHCVVNFQKTNDDDENSDKQNEDNYDENRNEEPVAQQEQETEIEYGPPEILDYHPLPHVQKSAKVFHLLFLHLIPSKLYHVRIPNILGIDPKPFDPNSYEEVKLVDEEGNAKKTHTNPETVIRWRYELDSNGIPIVTLFIPPSSHF